MDSGTINLSVANEEVKLLDLVKQEALTLLKEKIIEEIGNK